MKNILVATIAALTIAGLSSGAFAAAPAMAMKPGMKPAGKMVVVKHPAHWGMHQVCKIKTDSHHHKTKVCVWVK